MLHSNYNPKYIRVVKRPRVINNAWGGQTTITCEMYEFTEEGERWFIENFATTFNSDIMELMGVSEGHLHREARRLNLKKSETIYTCPERSKRISEGQKKFFATEKGKRWKERASAHITRVGIPHRYGTPEGEERRQEMLADVERKAAIYGKIVENRNKIIKSERARAIFGIEQKTKFKFRATYDMKLYSRIGNMRANLRTSGCTIGRGSFAVYNHEGVSELQRENAKKLGFVFKN